MDKLKILKTLDTTSYIAIINATVFVLLFQYAAVSMALYVSLISYIIAFVSCFTFCFLRFYFSSGIQERDNDYALSKIQKFWILVKLMLSIIFLVIGILIFVLW